MWKKTAIAAVWLAATCGAPARADLKVSAPVAGVARHLLTGSALSPEVRWKDNPRAAADTGGRAILGQLEITFRDAATAHRTLLLSSSCSGDREKTMKFTYEGAPADGREGGGEQPWITAIPEPPVGWAVISGSDEATDEGTLLGLSGVNAWTKGGQSVADKAIVIVSENSQSEHLLPGYYSATYCVQQMVE